MASGFSEYQKQVNRLISQHPDAVPVFMEIMQERMKELHQLWLAQIDVTDFDERRLRGYHKGTTEVKKLLLDMEHALIAFREAAAAQTGDDNGGE